MTSMVTKGRPIARRGWARPLDLKILGARDIFFVNKDEKYSLYTVKVKQFQTSNNSLVWCLQAPGSGFKALIVCFLVIF